MVIVLVILAVVGLVFFQFNKHKIQDSTWVKMNYPYLHEINNPRSFEVEGYEFIKLSDQKIEFQSRVILHPEREWYSTETSDNPNFWNEQSKVFYNPEKEIFASLVWDGSWLFFNTNGEIIKNLDKEERLPESPSSWVMIKDLGNWNSFSDQRSELYVTHFSKEQHNWSRYNPLSNLGSPTAGHGSYWWWKGNAYMKVLLENGEFIFKTDGQLLEESGDRTEYKVSLSYCKIPKEYSQGKDLVLLFQESFLGNMKNGVFMIREK